MDLSRLTKPERVSAASMVIVVIAAFLPWVSVLGISVRGTSGDGVITLVLALAGLVVLATTSGLFRADKAAGKASSISLVVLASLVAVVGLIDMNGAAAIGLYLTFFAGIAWLVGAIWQLSSGVRPAPTEATD